MKKSPWSDSRINSLRTPLFIALLWVISMLLLYVLAWTAPALILLWEPAQRFELAIILAIVGMAVLLQIGAGSIAGNELARLLGLPPEAKRAWARASSVYWVASTVIWALYLPWAGMLILGWRLSLAEMRGPHTAAMLTLASIIALTAVIPVWLSIVSSRRLEEALPERLILPRRWSVKMGGAWSAAIITLSLSYLLAESVYSLVLRPAPGLLASGKIEAFSSIMDKASAFSSAVTFMGLIAGGLIMGFMQAGAAKELLRNAQTKDKGGAGTTA